MYSIETNHSNTSTIRDRKHTLPEHRGPLQVRDFLDILLVRLIRVSPALQGDLDLLGDPVRLARC